MTISYTSTEIALRTLLGDLAVENQAAYVGFDMYIHPDKNKYDQRDVRVGVHLLRWRGRVLGAADDRFLCPQFEYNKKWEEISTHNSCWADSTMHWMKRIIKDVMENQSKSRYTERYEENELSYDPDNYDDAVHLSGIQVLSMDDVQHVLYVKRTDDSGFRHRLVPEFMLEEA